MKKILTAAHKRIVILSGTHGLFCPEMLNHRSKVDAVPHKQKETSSLKS